MLDVKDDGNRLRLRKRFLILTLDMQYVASVYADSFTDLGDVGGGQGCGHFYIGSRIIASVDTLRYRVGDSTGRVGETPEQIHKHIQEEFRRELVDETVGWPR